MALLMISAIISDTLYFRSPTTTQFDRTVVEELNAIAGIENLESYSLEMFDAKSNLGDISVRQIIMLDYKNFEAGGKKFGAGVAETTNPSFILNKKSEIIAELNKIKAEQNVDFIMLSVVDILNEKNTTIVANTDDEKTIKEVFHADTHDGLADLENRVSRKKQIAPPITDYFTSLAS